MPANYSTSTFKVNFKIIDWMRGLAALYVVLNHSRGFLFSNTDAYVAHVAAKSHWHWWEWLSIFLMSQTNLSVEFVILFFLLSGFSIAHSLDNNNNVKDFYVRRLVRLYPPYLLGIIWALLVFMFIATFASPVFNYFTEGHEPLKNIFYRFCNPFTLLENIFYIPKANYLTPQYWSLPFEVVFYLIIPWLIRKFNIYAIISLIIFMVAWLILGTLFLDDEKTPIIPQYIVDFNIFFVIGIIFYRYRDYFISKFKISKHLSLFLLMALFESMVIIKGHFYHEDENKLTGVMMCLFSFILIFSALKHSIRIAPLEKIGSFSYTLYVTHAASIYLVKTVFYILGNNFYNDYLTYEWYFGIIAAVFLAFALYYIAEYPSVQLLKKLRKKTSYSLQTI
jgi:peptidoglycan/LPS O-acetylase OafA/YrhL